MLLAAALAAVPVLVGGRSAAGDHQRADGPPAQRRRGVHRRGHVAVDARLGREWRPHALRARTGRGARLQAELPGIPVGIASFTDRVLPHLFPTVDERVFRETMNRSVGIERPPPSTSFGTNVTTLDALGVVPTLNFFTSGVKKRVLVVFTDGDSQPVSRALESDFSRKPRVDTTFVHMGNVRDRIYTSGVAEAGYAQDPTSGLTLTAAVNATNRRVFEEGNVGEVAAAVRSALGTGPTVNRRIEGSRRALMPFVALLAAIPLGFVLIRRNL